MIAHQRQVRNLIFFSLVLIACCSPVLAKETFSSKGKERSASGVSGAGGNKVLSMKDIVGSLSNTFDGIMPHWDSEDEEVPSLPATRSYEPVERVSVAKPEPKSANDIEKPVASQPQTPDAKQPVVPEEPKLIRAKRLDEPNVDSHGNLKKDTAPAPYRVYSAPMIPDEPEVPETPVVRRAEPPSMPAPAFDMKEPPTLNNESFFKSVRLGGPRATAWEAASEQQKAPRVSDARPSSALPKQFFPIFPVGAQDDELAQLLPIASNIELEADHSNTARAIIVIHDLQRNSAENVASLMTLSGVEGEQVLILAPHFSLDVDIMRFASHLPENGRTVARWIMDDPWQYGGESVLPNRNKGITSFTAMDILLLYLSDRQRFPYLQQVVIAGHGIGADFVQRYAAMGRATDILIKDNLPVRFVVANPSTLMYMTIARPAETGTRFINPDMNKCPKLNHYPFGLVDIPAYGKRVGANAIRERYPSREVIYLASDKIYADHILMHGCEADAQGESRLLRSKNYGRYMAQSFGEAAEQNHTMVTVTGAGYDPVSLYGSQCGVKALFGDGVCRTARP